MNILNLFSTVGMAGGQQGAQQSGPVMMIVWVAIMIALFYFMLIRPQQRKEKERLALIGGIKTGDRIIFGGGIIGTVANLKDKVLVVKVSEDTKLEILRASVTQVLRKEEDVGEASKERSAHG